MRCTFPTLSQERTARLQRLFYFHLTRVSTLVGPWFFSLFARAVALGYFVFLPSRVRTGLGFYRALLPGKRRFTHFGAVLRQFQNFTQVFLDRFLLQSGHRFDFTFEGRNHLQNAMAQGTGGIIVMSHMGNWELAAHLLHHSLPELPLMLFLGQRAGDAIEQLQKQDLKTTGIRVVTVNQEQGAAFELLPALGFLKTGGFVSITGDRVWHPSQRALPARFLDRQVRLPEAPHALALVSGAPLFFFFASRNRNGRYHFKLSAPQPVKARDRADRRAALARSVQAYAGLMEAQLRATPFEWYHFEPFLSERGCDDG